MDDKTIDLRELYYILEKNIRLISKITGGFIVLAVLYLLIASPVYESEALLRVKQPKGLSSSILDSLPMGNTMATKQQMSTYAEILKSRNVVVPVIEATEEVDSDGEYPRYEDYVKERVTTVPFKDTEIMKVSVTYKKDPKMAQQTAQLLVNGFLNRLTELSRAEQKATRQFIEERTLTSEDELDQAESALNKYRRDHKIISPTEQMQLVSAKLAMIDKLEAENKVALSAAQAKGAAVNNILGSEARVVADNAAIKQYTAKLGELEAQRIAYLDKYTEKHPRMQEINQAIAELQQKVQSEINRVASLQAPSDNPVHQQLIAEKFSSQASASVAQSNLDAVKRLNTDYENDIGKLSEKEQEFLKLARKRNVSQEIYVMLSKRLEEAKVAEMSVSTEVQVVDEPTLPDRPIKPRKGLTLILAALLGLMGSSAFVIARELMNRTVKTTEDIQNVLGIPVLAQIPDIDSLQGAMKKQEEKPGIAGLIEKVRRRLWKNN